MTITSDLNAVFTAERRREIAEALAAPEKALAAAAAHNADIDRRIAEGKLVDLGNGRYRVEDPGSWDNGEIWTLQYKTVGEEQLRIVLPEHGLDMSTGTAALYTRVPAWHGLGTVVPEGVSDIYEVLRLAQIDYEVSKRPVQYRNPLTGDLLTLPDQYVTVREDTGAGLGVVGKKYEVFQAATVFSFLHELLATSDVVAESAGALRGGSKIFITLRLPETVTIDPEGINDQIVPYIAAVNSYDGQGQAQIVCTPWRIECANTERFAIRDAHTRWGVRHTRNGLASERINEARRTLKLASQYFEQYAREEQALAQTRITLQQFEDLMLELWPAPDGAIAQAAHTRHANLIGDVQALWARNSTRLGNTAYAAERAITEYLDHHAAIRPTGSLKGKFAAARATAMIEGAQDEKKAKAHKQLLTLTHR